MMGDGWFVYMLVSVLCFLPSLQLLKLFWTNSVPWVRAHSAGRAAGSSAYHWHHWVPVWPGEYYLQVLVPCAAAADDDDVTGCLAAKQLVGQWEAVDAAVLVCLMPHSSLSTWTGPDGCSQRTIQAIALRVSSWGCKRDFWLAQKLHPQKEAVMPKHADMSSKTYLLKTRAELENGSTSLEATIKYEAGCVRGGVRVCGRTPLNSGDGRGRLVLFLPLRFTFCFLPLFCFLFLSYL